MAEHAFAHNPYKPDIATVLEAIQETPNIKTLRVKLDDPERMAAFTFKAGQVGQLSAFGAGEATFVINSPPTRMEYLQFSILRAGEVTTRLHQVAAGEKIGIRAPLGNAFPVDELRGKNILLIGGGIGMAPLRTLLLYLLDKRKDYGTITLLYGARSPEDLAFKYDIPGWLERSDMSAALTVDATNDPEWKHRVGLIPNVLLEMAPSVSDTAAVTCGPPIMIKFTLEALKKLGFNDENIITTLERRMKCGIGICGRCNIGGSYVCVDGPVYTYAQLRGLPDEL